MKWIFILVSPDTACYGEPLSGGKHCFKTTLEDLYLNFNLAWGDSENYKDFCRSLDLFDSKGYFNSEKQEDLNEVTRFLRTHGVPVFIGLFDMDDTFFDYVACY